MLELWDRYVGDCVHVAQQAEPRAKNTNVIASTHADRNALLYNTI